MLVIPDGIIKQVDRMLFNFLWDGRDRISRKAMIGRIEDGGINMIDVKSQCKSIKAAWIPRIIAHTNKVWTNIPMSYINDYGSNNIILKMCFNTMDSFPKFKSIPKFYQECILSFNSSKIIDKPHDLYSLRNQMIWGNRYFMLKKQTLFNKRWIADGIMYVKDIWDDIKCQIHKTKLFKSLSYKGDYFIQLSEIKRAMSPYNPCIDRIDDNFNVIDVNVMYTHWVCQTKS